MQTLAERLTWARDKAGISQEALSLAAGLSSRLVGMIERGSRPNPEVKTIRAIALTLDVKVGWLVSGDAPAPKLTQLKAAGERALEKADAAKRAAKGAA